jgi:hypothetical protein
MACRLRFFLEVSFQVSKARIRAWSSFLFARVFEAASW